LLPQNLRHVYGRSNDMSVQKPGLDEGLRSI
jgi:hypothetical protein